MKVFILAGEPSGDRLGGALMEGLKSLIPDVTFQGIGGEMMQAQGLRSQFPMDELSIMGLVEVLPKYFHLKRRIRETADAVLAMKPDVLITIDSPDFSLRVAALVKAASTIRTVHYVAPTVWAWRPHRAQKMAKVIDHVLALFPFEPPYMEAAGMDCDFVGHPVVAESQATEAEAQAFRASSGIGDAPLVMALPGSRRGEVTRLIPRFGEVLRRVHQARPDVKFVLPAAGPVAEMVREMTRDWPQFTMIDPRAGDTAAMKRAAFRAADVALAASGTVSLELAAARTPMVIAYDFNWLTKQMLRRLYLLDTATLVNIVSDTRTIPEFLGDDCTPDKITPALLDTLARPDAQLAAMDKTMLLLGQGGEAPGLRAARAVLSRL